MEKTSAIVFLDRAGDAPAIMLEPILFDPAALWLCESLKRAGVERFLVVCHHKDRERCAACFPEDTAILTEGKGLAEEVRHFLEDAGRAIVITEPVFLCRDGEARLAAAATDVPTDEAAEMELWGDMDLGETGIYELSGKSALSGEDVKAALAAAGKPYLGAMGQRLDRCPPQDPGLAACANREMIRRLADQGVRFLDPNAVYIGPRVTVERGTLILPGTILRGDTHIGKNCEIGPNTMLRDVTVGESTTVNSSQASEAVIGSFTTVGPFAYIRPNTTVGDHVKVGDFVELKNSVIGDETKISHLTYVGDSDVGEHINFGCGTVTVNYDGAKKFRTKIGDGAFIGCNTNLVAPVSVGEGAYIAAGSTITRDVPSDSLAIARSQQTVKNQWAKKRRAKQQQEKEKKG